MRLMENRKLLFRMWGIASIMKELSEQYASKSERKNWLSAFKFLNVPKRKDGGFDPGCMTKDQLITAFIIVVMFCKSTNGTGDRIVVPHFRRICQQITTLSLEECVANPLLIARYLRQTSDEI